MLERWSLIWQRIRSRWKWLGIPPAAVLLLWVAEAFLQDLVVKALTRIGLLGWARAPSVLSWIGQNPLSAATVAFLLALSVTLLWSFLETRPRRVDSVLEGLSQMRTQGVALRNRVILDPARVQAWVDDVQTWNDQVISKLRGLSPTEAEMFRTLDWVTFPKIPNPVNEQHGRFMRMHSQRLQNLEKIIRKYQGKEVAEGKN